MSHQITEDVAEDVAAILNELPDLLRSAREARGMSYRDVAHQTGMSASSVHQIEHRHHPDIRVSTAVMILDWIASDPRV